MPVRHDPILARALAREIGERHAGRRTRELLLDRDRRLATLRFRSGPSLLFLLHPEAGHVVETERTPGEVRLGLGGLRLRGAASPVDERLLLLDLPPDGPEGTPHRLALELMTNQWNLLLLRRAGGDAGGTRDVVAGDEGEDRADDRGVGGAAGDEDADGSTWIVRAALWPREPGDRVLRSGAKYRPPRGRRRFREAPPEAAEWREVLGDPTSPGLRKRALREVAWLSSVNVGWVLAPVLGSGRSGDADDGTPDGPDEAAGGDDAGSDEAPAGTGREGADGVSGDGPDGTGASDAIDEALERYRRLRDGEPGAWLLERDWGLQPYPLRLDGADAEESSSLLAGMARSLAATEGWAGVAGLGEGGDEEVPPEAPELAELRDALEAQSSRIRRRIEALGRELEEGPDPGVLRETANLILARLDRIPRGREEVTLETFEGGERTVELDPTLSPSDNADRHYEEAARRERALEKIPRERKAARERLEKVEEALEELRDARELPEGADVEALWRLAGGRPPEEEAEDEERLPYRRLYTSGGFELRIGKGAKSNEDLTFHHSHTEDVWLHARQVPGAHVILRWGRKEGNPPRRDLAEAAVVAAVNSKARHSGTVGVDWTRRKYVRSPRKSPPGAVIPRNVQTIFVEPDEALVERLKRRGRPAG